MSSRKMIVVAAVIGTLVPLVSTAQEPVDEGHDKTVAMRPKPPYRMWYQEFQVREEPTLHPYRNWISAAGNTQNGAYLNERGIAVSRWTYGPQSPHSQGRWEYYFDQCNPHSFKKWSFTALDVDEWIPAGRKDYAICARGMREAKKKWPNLFLACYVTGTDQPYFRELVADGTVDLAIIEGYTNVWGDVRWRWQGLLRRCQIMADAGLIDKTIVTYGHLAEPLTANHLNRVVGLVHDTYPQMPGIGLFPGDRGDPEYNNALILYAERLCAVYHGDDVLFIDGFESGSFTHGGWQIAGDARIPPGFTWGNNDIERPWTGGYFDFCGDGEPATAELTEPGRVELNVLPILQAWLVNGKPNRGLMVSLGNRAGGLYGESRFARFYSSRSPNVEQSPHLLLQTQVEGEARTMELVPMVDGYLTVNEPHLITEPGLEAYFRHGQDHAAIYLRFALTNLTAEQIETLAEARLVLHATKVESPPNHTLQVFRIHEDNVNTEPFVPGAHAEKAALLNAGGSITRPVSTKGRHDIQLQYRYRAVEFVEGDQLLVEWHDGQRWHPLRRITHLTGFTLGDDRLPVGAADNESFAIRFSVVGNDHARAYVDLVRLAGDP